MTPAPPPNRSVPHDGRSHRRFRVGVLCLGLLVGCGGGEEAANETPPPVPPPPPSWTPAPPPVPPPSMTGLATTASALPVGTEVRAVCLTGKVATTLTAGGVYRLSMATVNPPCLLRARFGTGETAFTLYSLARGAGTTHITPLTHAAVGSALADGDVPALFDSAAEPVYELSTMAAQLAASQTRLRAVVHGMGVVALSLALDAVEQDFFTGPLVLASEQEPKEGDAHARLLVSLEAALGPDAASVLLQEAQRAARQTTDTSPKALSLRTCLGHAAAPGC